MRIVGSAGSVGGASTVRLASERASCSAERTGAGGGTAGLVTDSGLGGVGIGSRRLLSDGKNFGLRRELALVAFGHGWTSHGVQVQDLLVFWYSFQ